MKLKRVSFGNSSYFVGERISTIPEKTVVSIELVSTNFSEEPIVEVSTKEGVHACIPYHAITLWMPLEGEEYANV
jgi:hypothetical protein